MIARRLRDKWARGEPITIENFVADTLRHLIALILSLINARLQAASGEKSLACHVSL